MESEDPAGRKPALISLRSVVVLALALFVALAAGGLLYAGHRPVTLAVLGASSVFAAAVMFLNVVIELWLAAAARAAGLAGAAMIDYLLGHASIDTSGRYFRSGSAENAAVIERVFAD
jgi:hypothetical protein